MPVSMDPIPCRPTPACSQRVSEWLDEADLTVWRAPPGPLDRTYDGWLAAQPPEADESLRIVSPHDGDEFVNAPNARIMVTARGARQPSWELNGRRRGGGVRWILALRPVHWTLRAREGAHVDTVRFTVGPAPRHVKRAGFTVSG
jgi:hypothetical protein